MRLSRRSGARPSAAAPAADGGDWAAEGGAEGDIEAGAGTLGGRARPAPTAEAIEAFGLTVI